MPQEVSVQLSETAAKRIDLWIAQGRFRDRREAVESAVSALRFRGNRERLARELEKLDPSEERSLADEGPPGGPFSE